MNQESWYVVQADSREGGRVDLAFFDPDEHGKDKAHRHLAMERQHNSRAKLRLIYRVESEIPE